ncbi:hypothetical protein Tco_0670966 [Tanacetum coccineum]
MILESVENGQLVWPTVEENGVIRTKKYAELSVAEKIQADCDMKATNIIIQGLPGDIYSLVNHHRVAKDLWKRVQLLMQCTSLTKQERECKLFMPILNNTNSMQMKSVFLRERNQDPLASVANQQMTPPQFNTYQSSYDNPQLQQQFSPSQMVMAGNDGRGPVVVWQIERWRWTSGDGCDRGVKVTMCLVWCGEMTMIWHRLEMVAEGVEKKGARGDGRVGP